MQEEEKILEEEVCDEVAFDEDEPNEFDLEDIDEEEYDLDSLDLLNDSKIPVNDSFRVYLSQIRNYKLLTKDQEIELFKRYKEGDMDAKDLIINSNLRLVIAIAIKLDYYRLSVLDLIQAGNEGLLTATERFEYERGFRFSTYATWWIKQAIYRTIANENRSIRLPVNLVDFNTKLVKARNALLQNLSREPTTDEYYEYFDRRYEKAKIERSLLWLQNSTTISLDAPISQDSDSALYDVVGLSGAEDNVKKGLEQEDKKAAIQDLLDTCCKCDRDRRIITLLYGLEDGVAHTLDDTAQIIFDEHYDKKRVTRERVRQIESKFLDNVRKSPSRLQKLRELMEDR